MNKERRYPDRRDQLTRQDAQVTQFGQLRTAQGAVTGYTQGRYSPDAIREIETEENGATITNGQANATLDSGTNADGLARLTTKRSLDYAPDAIYEWTRALYVPDGLQEEGVLTWGLANLDETNSDGVGFQATADTLDPIILTSMSGSKVTRKLRDIDPQAVRLNVDAIADPELLEVPHIWGVLGSYYGTDSLLTWFIRTRQHVSGRDPGRVTTILAEYTPAKDPYVRSTTDGPQYMRTANLPSSLELKNNGTAPASSTEVLAGDTQFGVIGDNPKEPQTPGELYTGFVASNGVDEMAVAIDLKDTFSGVPNDVNVVLVEVEITVEPGNGSLAYQTYRLLSATAGNFDHSQYGPGEAVHRAGIGAGFEVEDFEGNTLTGDVEVDRSEQRAIGPRGIVQAGSQKSRSGGSENAENIQLVIGRDEVIGLAVKGLTGTPTFHLSITTEQNF